MIFTASPILPAAETNLWLHVNTFFIKEIISILHIRYIKFNIVQPRSFSATKIFCRFISKISLPDGFGRSRKPSGSPFAKFSGCFLCSLYALLGFLPCCDAFLHKERGRCPLEQRPLSESHDAVQTARNGSGGLFGGMVLGGPDKQRQHCNGEDHAHRVSHSGVVEGRTLCGLVVEQAAEALVAQQEVGSGHRAHEGRRHRGDPVVLLLDEEVHGSRPQDDHGQRLVGPAEVTPDNRVVDEAQRIADAEEGAHAQNRDAELQAVGVAVLIDLEPVGQRQTCGTERGIARGDGADHDADHSQRDADAAHGLGADVVDGGRLAFGQRSSQTGVQAAGDLVQGAAGCGPDQGNDALADHCAVEDEVTLLLTLHAACHQRRLGGVEAGNGTAGHGDEHEAPDRGARRMHIIEVAPDLGDGVGGVGEDAKDDAHRHDDQADAEDRVDLADDGVDGNKGCDEVIDQNEDQPEQGRGQYTGQAAVLAQGHDQTGRADRKHGTDHDQQHDREHTHDVLHHGAEVLAGDLCNGAAVVALTHHTGEVVVDAACKDGAEGDPQEHHRAPQCALHRTEDRAKARDVQQLDEEQLPLGHHDVVHAVVDADRRRLPVIRPERVVHDLAVDEVAADQDRKTE